MKRRLVAFTLATLAAVASRNTPAQEPSGVIVEEVAADSSGAKSGLLAGDRIASYDGRSLPSPAALLAAEENTFGRDTVTVRVQRERESLTLAAPPGKLGIQVRPDLLGTTLTTYEEGRAAQKERPAEAVARWSTAARTAQDAGALASAAWLLGRVGEIHESQRQWKLASRRPLESVGVVEADQRCGSALTNAGGVGTMQPECERLSGSDWMVRAGRADGRSSRERHLGCE